MLTAQLPLRAPFRDAIAHQVLRTIDKIVVGGLGSLVGGQRVAPVSGGENRLSIASRLVGMRLFWGTLFAIHVIASSSCGGSSYASTRPGGIPQTEIGIEAEQTGDRASAFGRRAVLEGRLDPTDHARFKAHLAKCDGCTTHVEQMRQTLAALGRIPQETISPEARQQLLQIFDDFQRGGVR